MVSPWLAFSSYCIYSKTIMELIGMKEIEITVLDESEPGKARMKYTTRVEGGNTWESEFVFDKERSWAIISHRNSRLSTDVEYGDSINGVPMAKRLVHYWNGDFKTPAFVSILKDIKPGPVPDSVFTLADFGLPELPQPKKPGFPVFATLGLLGLVVSIILALFIRKRSAPNVEVT
jgi:hypothetical protein